MSNDLIKCPKCGEVMSSAYSRCVTCGANLRGTDVSDKYEKQNEGDTPLSASGNVAIEMLKFFAWMDLVVSIIAALLIIVNNSSLYSIGLALGILLQGMLVCSLFLVIASMAVNLIAIRKNTGKQIK